MRVKTKAKHVASLEAASQVLNSGRMTLRAFRLILEKPLAWLDHLSGFPAGRP